MTKVFSSVGIRANELLAAGLHGFATNPASKWFSLSMADERLMDHMEVRQWLSTVEAVMWRRMYAPGTNFITALHEIYLELGCFGTSGLHTDWNDKDEHLIFSTRTLSNILVTESSKGIIDTSFRKFQWTSKKIKDEWGNAASRQIDEALKSGEIDKKFDIIHCIMPREDYNYLEFSPSSGHNMPFASIYFEYESEQLLEESGYPENPYSFPRWFKVADEVYGRSPAMTALPDIQMYQEIRKNGLVGLQKAVDPPVVAAAKGFINPLKLIPSGVNYTRGNPKEAVYPIPFTGNLSASNEELMQLRNEIFDTFHVDQLQIVNDANMTATEVMQRTQERMRILGPILGRLESELLGPLVTRVFGLLERLGEFPQPPEIIEEQDFTVQYVSPIAQAQRSISIDTWQRFVEACGVYLQDPSTAAEFFKLYPVHKVTAHFAKLLNLDPDMGASDEERQAADQDAQMEKLAMMAQPFQQAAQGVNQLTQAGAGVGAAVEGVVQGVEGTQAVQDTLDPAQLQNIANGINLTGATQ